jgi:hypothetical protein
MVYNACGERCIARFLFIYSKTVDHPYRGHNFPEEVNHQTLGGCIKYLTSFSFDISNPV